jgi:enoyl-CoA hydratase
MIDYEMDGSVAVIVLNRPEKANAQNAQFLRELQAAMQRAEQDDEAVVIVLRANGRHFSAGHDLAGFFTEEEHALIHGREGRGTRDHYGFEAEMFVRWTREWRDLPKPTIAAVQGACVASGLMLAWACDLIIAADDARFGDSVMKLGMGPGVEYAAHTWEFGVRKAKELLFTGGFIDAAEAHRIGMVNRVVPGEELESATLALAHEIAQMDPFALRMAKRAVNLTQDIQGYRNSIEAVFDMHMVNHAHTAAKIGIGVTIDASTGKPLDGVRALAEKNRAAMADG